MRNHKTREMYQRWTGRQWVDEDRLNPRNSLVATMPRQKVMQAYLPRLDRWAVVRVLEEPETAPSLL